jgi:hypothetical protein
MHTRKIITAALLTAGLAGCGPETDFGVGVGAAQQTEAAASTFPSQHATWTGMG